ncbi:hypothetical protein B0H10DRAFT_2085402 [Mycena sp. CBHHK59/15]|nr:hypothetical protein B0H10DRAFT_2085402 [Mycena sp. CBHHK59/15]
MCHHPTENITLQSRLCKALHLGLAMASSHKFWGPSLITFALLFHPKIFAAATANAEEQIVFQAVNNTATYLNDSSFSVSVDDIFESNDDSTLGMASLCCAALGSTLPGRVFFPDSEEYQAQEASYYSLTQSDLKPSCRVSPTSADDVSAIVSVAGKNGCKFAVRSGGHMSWKGSSNIGPSGFTIDLQKLNSVSLSRDQSVVSIGAGCTWRMVYHSLDPYHLSTVGGRTSDVGVAGFLLGGGISFLSLEHGFGSDNVVAYEIVLADGTICVATPNSHPDLYWAIKYGSTNFGIVTRFDMTTFPLDKFWGGAFFYNISQALPLLDSLVTFTAKLADDPKGMSAFGFLWNSDAQDYIVWGPSVYMKPVEFPPLFSDLSKIEPLSSTMRMASLVEITDEISDLFAGGVRTQWFTLTVKANAQILFDIQEHGAAFFKPDRGRPGFISGLTVQPINVGLVAAGSRNGGNPIGMSTDDGDLILLLASLFWSDPADDAILIPKFQEFFEWTENEARQRGLLNRFLYMNYALGNQDVMGSVGEENLSRMRKIRDRYDPNDVFKKYWKGGYKL